jgi:gliding motility-associated-like protein
VNVVTVPSTPTITPAGSTTFCSGGSVILQSNSGTGNQWYKDLALIPGETNQSYTAVTAGTYTVAVTNGSGCVTNSSSSGVIVTVNSLPNVTAISGPANVCVSSNISLTSTPAGGVWSSSNTGTATINSSGILNGVSSGVLTATYTYTDINSCSASAGAGITVNPLPAATISAGSSTTFCSGGSVTLTASAGSSWLWSTGATTQSITINTAGSYSVTVTNSNGCSATSAATIVAVNTLPSATINAGGPTTFCSGGSVTLTASTGSSWLWSTGATTQAITISSAGSYSVTVTNSNGCSATSAATIVTVNTLPSATINAGGPTTFCSGGSVTLTASTGSSWLWSTGATTQAINVNSTGNYSVTVTNSNGCSATSSATSVTVNALPSATVSAGGPTTFCSGGSVTLTAGAGSSWLWSTGATTQAITINNTGNYSVKITSANGCSATSTVTPVLVNPLPTLNTTNPAAVCSPATIDLTAPAISGNSTLTLKYYSDAATTNLLSSASAISIPGTYYINGTASATGCSVTQPITVNINQPPSIVINTPAAVCAPATVDLTAAAITAGSTAGLTYSYWTNSTTTTSLSTPAAVASTGTYYIKGVSTTGCSASLPVVATVNPQPSVKVNNPAAICSPGTVDLTIAAVTSGSTAGLNYSYWTNAANTTALSTPAAIATSGTYHIRGTVAATGCANSQPVNVVINAQPILNIQAPAAVCAPATIDLSSGSITAGSTAGLVFTRWTNPGATVALLNDNAVAVSGTYYIKGSSAAGCSAILPVAVTVNPQPSVIINSPAAVCAPGTIDLTQNSITLNSTAGLVFSRWSNAAATIPLVNETAVSTSGTYYIKGTLQTTGCASVKPVTTTVNPLPVGTIQTPAVNYICDGGSVILTASSASAYQWYADQQLIAGATGASYAATKAGTYSVQFTSVAGCSAFASNTARLDLLSKAVLAFTTDTRCVAIPVNFTNNSTFAASGGISWIWDFGDGTSSNAVSPVHTYAAAGTYNVTLTANNASCNNLTDSKTVALIIDQPQAGISYGAVNTFAGTPVLLQARSFGVQYLWQPATGLSNTTTQSTTATINQDQVYTVNISAATGCVTTDTVQVKIIQSAEIFVPQAFTPNGDGVNDRLYPIPEGISKLVYFRVFNRWGNMVFQTNDTRRENGWNGKYNGLDQPAGSYNWIAQAVDLGGKVVSRSGTVMLLK